MGGAILFNGVVATGPTNGYFWALLGNAGTVDNTNFFGTTDSVPINFRVNSIKSGRIDHLIHNVFFGYQSGLSITTGPRNAFYGDAAGKTNTIGVENNFFGSEAGKAMLDGSQNCAFGHAALLISISDTRNCAFGDSSLANLNGGVGNASDNSAFGNGSGNAVTTGKQNSLFGCSANVTVGTENSSIAIGYGALITTDNEMVVGGPGVANTFITRLRYVYSAATATHSEFFRTTTPEGAQVGMRGDIAYMNDGAIGALFLKASLTGNTGWLQLLTSTSGANAALSNLASVSINTSLLAQTGVDLGSAVKPFRELFLFGTGTYATTSIKLTGTSVGNVVASFPDNTGTVAELNFAQVWSAKQTFNVNMVLGALIEKYNGINTVSNGIASMIASSDLTVQGAAITATTLYAVPASGVGLYRVSWSAMVSRVATTSCSLGGATGFQLQYTDADDSVVKLSNPTTPEVSAINATGTQISGSFCCYCKASTNLQFLFGYTSVGVQSMQYSLHIKVEVLG